MGNDGDGVQGSPSGGATGTHPEGAPFRVLAAPATAAEFNRVVLRLVPVACWKIEDIRFAFDSSFVTPEATAELQALKELRESHSQEDLSKAGPKPSVKYPPLTIFGHADPVGPASDPDGYNKALSGRRAKVIYALLIVHSDPETAAGLWRQVAREENWGGEQKQVMQDNVPEGTSAGDLMEAYMKALCPGDLVLTPDDFLSTGADSKGKYQGCSSFNPIIVFSEQKQVQFDAAQQNHDQAGIQARNDANAPNRRVMILLFSIGSKVVPGKWPCPRATEGVAGCKLRFWGNGADGETRRSTRLPTNDRTFEQGEDTFACRFYQRITDRSPCHKYEPPKPCDQKSFPPRNVNRPVTEVISGAPPPYTAWNNTYSWDARFTVAVIRNPCAITVIVKLRVTGTISAAQKSAWKAAIEAKWNGKVKLYCPDASCARACPDGYPLSVDVQYVRSGQHHTVAAGPATRDMAVWGVNDTVDITHEFGHMLGNPEEYFTTNGVNWAVTVDGVNYPFRSPNGSVMNNPANDPAPRHYDMIRQEAGKAMGIDCQFDKPAGPGDFPQPPANEATV
jgi:hypothetical protein